MADHDDDDAELMLVMMTLSFMEVEADSLIDNLETMLARHIREQQRLNRALPIEKKRVTWQHFSTTVSATHFRRMFRMEVGLFGKLCALINQKIGQETFKREACHNNTTTTQHNDGITQQHNDHTTTQQHNDDTATQPQQHNDDTTTQQHNHTTTRRHNDTTTQQHNKGPIIAHPPEYHDTQVWVIGAMKDN